MTDGDASGDLSTFDLELEGDGRNALVAPPTDLDCGNSGTTMRLLAGILAAAPFTATLVGDPSLNRRPMERVAEPLRTMGAAVETLDGHAPLTVRGSTGLRGIEFSPNAPSAQVKSAVLLAGTAAAGTTAVLEPVATRDHTERALAALGGPVEIAPGRVEVVAFQHDGFEGRVPGDPSSAAFLVAAAALTGSEVEVEGVGLNPTRTRFLEVMRRMGMPIVTEILDEQVGEPVGTIRAGAAGSLRGTTVTAEELPLVIDEIPVLAALAAHAEGQSSFLGGGELRVKESDRLATIAEGIRGLGGEAGVEGEDLVVAGFGARGGSASAAGDHRIAMALTVAALAADGPSVIEGVEHADVSFPGFVAALRALGAHVEPQA